MKLEKSSHEAYKLVHSYAVAIKYYRCCFCKRAIDYRKEEGEWYLDLDKQPRPNSFTPNSFYIFCNDTCLNCFILQGK